MPSSNTIIGVNDLATQRPDLAKEWNYEKNGELKPENVLPGSNKKVWWKCANGHEWQAVINSRNQGKSCPYCSNHKVWEGYNDLATTMPNLAKEWHPVKNASLFPKDVTLHSGKKVWWKCDKGHEWQASIDKRANGQGCPICNNRSILEGVNDLASQRPDLAKEWHPTRNGNLLPTQIAPNSGKKIWWRCKFGHEWQADLHSRSAGAGCPYCAQRIQSSFPEQAFLFYTKLAYPDTNSRTKNMFNNGMELDIYIPSIKTGIEYDGAAWHNTNESNYRDLMKYRLCNEQSIKLIRIKEIPCNTSFINCDCEIKISKDPNYSQLDKAISQLLDLLLSNNKVDVNVERDYNVILSNYITSLENGSLLFNNPKLADEWNFDKNLPLTPYMISAKSNKKVWWKCINGHEWQASVNNRQNGFGCPYCSGQMAIIGENDFQTLYPEIAKEWDYDRNGHLKPNQFLSKSGKKVWWKCSKGHEWQSTIYNRVSGHNCPYCQGNKVVKGVNDLLTLDTNLANEWHPTKNGMLTPSDVSLKSNRKVWWKCSKGHEWQTTVYNRTSGHGCPFCSGRKAIAGLNDLASQRPDLANDWDYKKNLFYPDDITCGSNKNVWWKCAKCGYEWNAKISYRNRHSKCPNCRN